MVHGVKVVYATAAWQAAGLVTKICLTMIWSWLAYRLNYSAYAKQTQSALNLVKTTLHVAANLKLTETGLLAMLLAITGLTGFYATIMSAVLDPIQVNPRLSNVTLSGNATSESYMTQETDQAIWRLSDRAIGRNDFVTKAPAATYMEELSFPLMAAVARDGVTYNNTLGDFWGLRGSYWHRCLDDADLTDDFDGLWQSGFAACTTENMDNLLHNFTGVSWNRDPRWNYQEDHANYIPFSLDSTVPNTKVEQREVYAVGYDSEVLVESQSSLLTFSHVSYDGKQSNAREYISDSPEQVKGQEIYSRHTLSAVDGLVTERVSAFMWTIDQYDNPLVSGYDANRTYLAVGSRPRNTFSKEIQLGYSEGLDLAARPEGNKAIMRGQPLDSEERKTGLRNLLLVHRREQVKVILYEVGYRTQDVILSTTLPLILAVLALAIYSRTQPFEGNSLTENLFVNNNTGNNDCASVGWALRKSWWQPELWATREIVAGYNETHVSVLIDGKIFKAREPPIVLSKLPPSKDLSGMRSAAAY